MQDVSIFLENSPREVFEHVPLDPRIRIRINSPCSAQRLMEVLRNIFQTLTYQFRQVFQETYQICYQTWLNWSTQTAIWSQAPQSDEETENDRRAQHPFQEVSLEWNDLQQLVQSSTRIPRMKPKITYRNFNEAARVFKSSKQDCAKLTDCDCGICLEELMPNRMWARLPCGHTFHSNCAKKWVCRHSQQPSCPTCRAPVSLKNH